MFVKQAAMLTLAVAFGVAIAYLPTTKAAPADDKTSPAKTETASAKTDAKVAAKRSPVGQRHRQVKRQRHCQGKSRPTNEERRDQEKLGSPASER